MNGSKDSVTSSTTAPATVSGAASVNATSVSGSMTPAKQSLLQRIEAMLHGIEDAIAHDEAAMVDFVKRHL